jgi:hypothetical protein
MPERSKKEASSKARANQNVDVKVGQRRPIWCGPIEEISPNHFTIGIVFGDR